MASLAGLQGGNSAILLPLSKHAQSTLNGLSNLHSQSALKVSPFCHEHPEGAREVRGWCLDTPGTAHANALPINCSMFDGITIVKCDCSEAEILELLSDSEDTRRRLGDAISRIMERTEAEETRDLRATWSRCRPTSNGTPESLCSAHIISSKEEYKVNFFNTDDNVPLIDNDYWIPELSPEGFIGIYHHWNHAKTMNDSKGPSLYIACQSYLPDACLEFADMVRSLGDRCSASDICQSEEAHWLRKACSRNRARLISEVCHDMKIKYPAMLDYNACQSGKRTMLAFATYETLHHDLQSLTSDEKETIRLYNFCTSCPDTACVMSPWDGLWVFHGDHQTQLFFPSITPKIAENERYTMKHGSVFMFSTNVPETCEVLDIFFKKEIKSRRKRKALTTMVKKNNSIALDILSSMEETQISTVAPLQVDAVKEMLLVPTSSALEDADVMIAYNRSISKMASLVLEDRTNQVSVSKKKTYLYFDEHVLNAMEKQGWKRTNGYTVFIPLACGLCEQWKRLVNVDQL